MSLRLWFVKRQVRKMFRPKEHMHAAVDVIGAHFATTLTSLEDKIPGAPKDATITPVSEGTVRGDWVSAPGARDDRVFYYIHGGGYVWGRPKDYHELAYRLSKLCKARVFMLDYGLAPEVQAPIQLEEGLAGYDHIVQKYPDANVIISGDSAGGGLAHSTTIAIRDSGRKALAGSALIAPWVDITGSGGSVKENLWKDSMLDARSMMLAADAFRGDLAADDPRCSALYAEQAGLPPTLIQVGQDEILRDDGVRLAAKIKEAGGTVKLDVWPKVYHVWHRSAAIVPEARRAIQDIGDFCEPLWAA